MLKVITFAIGSLSTGGIGRNTINLSKYFISNGFEVDILLTTHEKEIRTELVPIGVNIVNLGKRSRYAIFNTVKYLKSRRRCRWAMAVLLVIGLKGGGPR